MPDNPSPDMLKKMKMDTPAVVDFGPEQASPQGASNGKGKARAVTVEDVAEDGMDVDQAFAPGGDADYFAEEDDEGRFFGGGLTSEQKDILNIFDKAGDEGVQDDVSSVCRGVVNLTTC